jgi:hypothetical protein
MYYRKRHSFIVTDEYIQIIFIGWIREPMNICVVRFDLDRPYIFIGDVAYTQGCHYGPAYIRRLIDEYMGVWKNGGFPFPPPPCARPFFIFNTAPCRSALLAPPPPPPLCPAHPPPPHTAPLLTHHRAPCRRLPEPSPLSAEGIFFVF